MSEETKWFKKEMIRLNNELTNLKDRHNTDTPDNTDRNDIQHLINSSLRYTPEIHHNWTTYTKELEMHVRYADEKNRKKHISGPKQWHTHVDPSGCFMCEDIALRHVMLQVIQYMATTNPKGTFKPKNQLAQGT